MRKTLTALVVWLQLACATPVRPTPSPDPAAFPCKLGEGEEPREVLTRPSIDQKVLAAGLMPAGHPGGFVIVKCNVMTDGEIRNCRSIKDEGGLAAIAIRRLLSMHATAATCRGQPIPIDYVFNLNFKP